VSSAHYPAAVWELQLKGTPLVYLFAPLAVSAFDAAFAWFMGNVQNALSLAISPTILYMISELRHYLAGSNYGSDTPED